MKRANALQAEVTLWKERAAEEARRHLYHDECLVKELEAENEKLRDYKRLYELRGKALFRACLQCGYEPKKITLASGEIDEAEVEK